jgi:HEPN domain-containing protein
MIALAEALDPAAPGVAGLAYQAANLAIKVLLVQVDGSDTWLHAARNQRAGELLAIDADDLSLLHHTRQLDFYTDTTFGGEPALPEPGDCQRALAIARLVVDAVATRLRS